MARPINIPQELVQHLTTPPDDQSVQYSLVHGHNPTPADSCVDLPFVRAVHRYMMSLFFFAFSGDEGPAVPGIHVCATDTHMYPKLQNHVILRNVLDADGECMEQGESRSPTSPVTQYPHRFLTAAYVSWVCAFSEFGRTCSR